MSQTFPPELRYTKQHEWARRDGELVTIGITAHAVEQLGDITMVTLPDVGTEVGQDESLGDIDSVKAVSELYSPVAGAVVEINASLEDSPETINKDPYAEGWLLKIKPSDAAQLDGLLDAKAYEALVGES